MAKRSIEKVIEEARAFKLSGMSTFCAMAATMNDAEWDDLLELIERLQGFWKSRADRAA